MKPSGDHILSPRSHQLRLVAGPLVDDEWPVRVRICPDESAAHAWLDTEASRQGPIDEREPRVAATRHVSQVHHQGELARPAKQPHVTFDVRGVVVGAVEAACAVPDHVHPVAVCDAQACHLPDALQISCDACASVACRVMNAADPHGEVSGKTLASRKGCTLVTRTGSLTLAVADDVFVS
eukprot:CAMPEP_0119315188 /NCGR_PEP_ID=MMETSP1333-20130426/34775_1 /TAXON_ID=418940 /ORGANISM="Scyphosphaera apsteinii, Strain RCC1455" /LENGTH=180 /DNA_ID=CAMNT_0007320461 /DNA_START=257 /DNA_END=799 /DNA_ORIENTATION=+